MSTKVTLKLQVLALARAVNFIKKVNPLRVTS